MPLLQQWVRQRPWLAAGLAVSATGLAGLSGGALAAAGALGLAVGGIAGSRPVDDATHPLRRRILSTLEDHPGLCYRELQQSLGAANGTLRHHLDVLQGTSRLTVMHVNGRTCYFAGPPESVELLQGQLGMSRAAERLPIGLSLVQRSVILSIREDGVPKSQSDLARRLGRTRASVHSAVKVLQRR
ncbi:MAG: winged helix-turn-helix transcriptional regulator, partial [Candidatus Poseidoniaceae archaeon]